MNVFDAVKDFHTRFEQEINQPLSEKLVDFRMNLMTEEATEIAAEFDKACSVKYDLQKFRMAAKFHPERVDKKALTKELADLLYVVVGFAVTFGLPLREVFEETHKSNMSKLGEDGKPIKRADGKVLKGPNYQAPDLEKYFN